MSSDKKGSEIGFKYMKDWKLWTVVLGGAVGLATLYKLIPGKDDDLPAVSEIKEPNADASEPERRNSYSLEQGPPDAKDNGAFYSLLNVYANDTSAPSREKPLYELNRPHESTAHSQQANVKRLKDLHNAGVIADSLRVKPENS